MDTEHTSPPRTVPPQPLAELLLETSPAFMDFVTSYLRRHSPIDNGIHFGLLRALRESPRALHQLAALHSVRMPTMSRTVATLEHRGWVTRSRSEEDRRSITVEITAEGVSVLETVRSMARNRVDELLKQLTPEEWDALTTGFRALNRVTSHLHPEQGTPCPDHQ